MFSSMLCCALFLLVFQRCWLMSHVFFFLERLPLFLYFGFESGRQRHSERESERMRIFANARRNVVLSGVVIMAEWIFIENSHILRTYNFFQTVRFNTFLIGIHRMQYKYVHTILRNITKNNSVSALSLYQSLWSWVYVDSLTHCYIKIIQWSSAALGSNYNFVSHSNFGYFYVAHASFHWTLFEPSFHSILFFLRNQNRHTHTHSRYKHTVSVQLTRSKTYNSNRNA